MSNFNEVLELLKEDKFENINQIKDYTIFITEAIQPKEIDYGVDLKDKKWKKMEMNFYVTYIKNENNIFAIIYNNGHIGFATNYKDPDMDTSKIESFKDLGTKYSFNRKAIPNVFSSFSYIFYVMIEAVEHFNPEKVYFSGADSGLKEFYETLVKNKFFIKHLNQEGFKYEGQEESLVGNKKVINFVFSKKD